MFVVYFKLWMILKSYELSGQQYVSCCIWRLYLIGKQFKINKGIKPYLLEDISENKKKLNNLKTILIL